MPGLPEGEHPFSTTVHDGRTVEGVSDDDGAVQRPDPWRSPVTSTSQTTTLGPRAELPETMQAVVCHGPEDYRLEEVAGAHSAARARRWSGSRRSGSAPAT